MISRRDWFRHTALGTAGFYGAGGENDSRAAWLRAARILIAEGYNSPFYPSLAYDPERALSIARRLNANAIRFPAAAYYAFFPTRSGFPAHPELGGRDLLARTIDLFHGAGLKVVVYIPLNHPFMDVTSREADYLRWAKRYADGRPMVTEHFGYTRYYDGCLNSPVRRVVAEMVREVAGKYAADVIYFDGPYQGMGTRAEFCHCESCEMAYRKARNKPVPVQHAAPSREDLMEYHFWMRDEVFGGFMREIASEVRKIRDVPMLYNDTGLLARRDWRSRLYIHLDGFMFEHAETPEQKLFNIQVGRSTGKSIWTYVGSYGQYGREHVRNKTIYGWLSYPVEGQELLFDGAVAMAAGAGLKYWGLNRFFSMPEDPLAYESGRYVREIFDFAETHAALLGSIEPAPQAGILTGAQTADWYEGGNFVAGAYANCYYGAFQVLKDLGYDAEPFLDYRLSAGQLARYRMLFIPNAACLSDAQCEEIRRYVAKGGFLLATHLTGVADELGRPRAGGGLADLFGIRWTAPDAVEVPDPYLRILPDGKLIPQDIQVTRFEVSGGTSIIGETLDRGRGRVVGPAATSRPFGKGRVLYIGSSLEAVYLETLMRPLREYFASLIDPQLAAARTYRVEYRPGLTAQFARSRDALVLFLLANTGNKWKKSPVRESYLPLENVRAGVRIPAGRAVKSVTLLRSGKALPWTERQGWIEVAVPRVLVYEAVHVELSSVSASA